MSKILLMTSTIAPSAGVFLLTHTDPEKRLQDYLAALSFYIESLKQGVFDKLVYADNSGHNLAALRKVAQDADVSDRCEFISFKTPAMPNLSRYFLEINLMREAIGLSRFLAEGDNDVWKVTGRYLIPNIAKIVRHAPVHADFYINCRDHPYKVVDFYLVRFSMAAFKDLLASDLGEFETSKAGEDILRGRIDAGHAPQLKIVPRFTVTPRIVGIRGHDGARYDGAKDLIKFYVRSALNTLLPKVWI